MTARVPAWPRLLRPAWARAYCGGMPEERFDRDVAPYARPRKFGRQILYDRQAIDDWLDRGGGTSQPLTADEWLRQMDDDDAEAARG